MEPLRFVIRADAQAMQERIQYLNTLLEPMNAAAPEIHREIGPLAEEFRFALQCFGAAAAELARRGWTMRYRVMDALTDKINAVLVELKNLGMARVDAYGDGADESTIMFHVEAFGGYHWTRVLKKFFDELDPERIAALIYRETMFAAEDSKRLAEYEMMLERGSRQCRCAVIEKDHA